ncbi:ParA family protein [Geoalkalibacter sp.]|uniref:ParA family protein n=1 Tax=Geoalkalibacter sp. TaxID=3041440 RepID=UPI00272E464D|nr:AAA family ATPase [Geoalkalibacter sp.]
MKVLASYNIKGGVGKTAAAVNLAWLSARGGHRTLVWDLDPQGAATYYFRVKAKVKGGGRGLVSGRRALDDLIKATDFANLDLLPADFSYRSLDLLLEQEKKPTRRLRKILKPLAEHYDVLLLDCPPSISLVSEAVFFAADALLVPVIPTTLSLRTLDQLFDFRARQQLDDLAILPFFSMVDRRKGLHREIVEQLPAQRVEMLKTPIPYASEVERMGLEKAPLGRFAARCGAAAAFESLWDEVAARLNIGNP